VSVATSIWGNRFIISAIVQGAIITGLTISIVIIQLLFSSINMIQFLSLSFEGPAKWVLPWLYFLHDSGCRNSCYRNIL
jgi:hypothetical protein